MTVADFAFASVLALSAILAAILVSRAGNDARRYVQFASALYGALSLSDLVAMLTSASQAQMLSGAVALIVMSLAPVALALAFAASFEGPPPPAIASTALLIGCAAGLAAAMTGAQFIAMTALFASVCAILTFAVRRRRAASRSAIQASVCGFALLAGAAADMTGGLEAQTSLALVFGRGASGRGTCLREALKLRCRAAGVAASNVIALVRRER
jgi:hypothetical protein